MSDLRDRIANVLLRDAFGLTTKSSAYRQADAVIAELGMAERECADCGRQGTQQFIRDGKDWVCRSTYACDQRRRKAKGRTQYCVRCGIPHDGECLR